MNIPNLKVTMFLTDIYGVGWQESHYRVDAFSPGTSLATYVDIALALAKARCACLHAAYYRLTDIRLSYDNVFRDSFLVKPGDIPQPTGAGNAAKYDGGQAHTGSSYQTVQSAIPMILTMREYKKRAINYMSGFSDQVAQHIRGTSMSPADYATFTAYGQFLCNLNLDDSPRSGPSNWGTKLILPETPVGTVLPPIAASKVSYIPVVGSKGTILHINSATPLDLHYATGHTVYLSGWKITTPQPRIRLNGSYEILARGHDPAPTDQDYIEIRKASMFVTPSSTSLGVMQGSEAFCLPYQNYTFRQATHHKRGKPSFEPVGRR